jgi:hypothetical protein
VRAASRASALARRGAARRVSPTIAHAAVRSTLELVESNPEQYPIAVDDIRKAPLRRFPYVVYYVIAQDHISAIAVMHSRRHPRRWKGTPLIFRWHVRPDLFSDDDNRHHPSS